MFIKNINKNSARVKAAFFVITSTVVGTSQGMTMEYADFRADGHRIPLKGSVSVSMYDTKWDSDEYFKYTYSNERWLNLLDTTGDLSIPEFFEPCSAKKPPKLLVYISFRCYKRFSMDKEYLRDAEHIRYLYGVTHDRVNRFSEHKRNFYDKCVKKSELMPLFSSLQTEMTNFNLVYLDPEPTDYEEVPCPEVKLIRSGVILLEPRELPFSRTLVNPENLLSWEKRDKEFYANQERITADLLAAPESFFPLDFWKPNVMEPALGEQKYNPINSEMK